MGKIIEIENEALDRFKASVQGVQVEFSFLSKYLDDENKTIYAKAWTALDELSNVLEDEINE